MEEYFEESVPKEYEKDIYLCSQCSMFICLQNMKGEKEGANHYEFKALWDNKQ